MVVVVIGGDERWEVIGGLPLQEWRVLDVSVASGGGLNSRLIRQSQQGEVKKYGNRAENLQFF